MKDTKFRILLDIHEVRSQATIPVKVGDVSCKIYITLVEGGKPYKIHENSFGVFTGKKGDDKHLFNNCVIENGIIRYDFTPQTVAAAGVLECEVRIYDEDGGVLTTPSFNIIVDERAVNDSELASSDEFSFLDEILVNEGQRIQNEKNRNEAFNNLGIDLEDDGEVISIVKTDIDGSQEKSTFLKYADVIPSITASASGSAITIESASAPLQNIKLFGKTEKNGTPTPSAPVPLVSVGNNGILEVGIFGKNLCDHDIQKNTNNSGLSITPNADKSVTIVGTATAQVTLWCYNILENLKVGETYIANGGTGVKVIENGVTSYRGIKQPILITENVTEVRLYIQVNSGVTVNSTFYPIVCHTNFDYNTYEPYNKQTLTITDTLRGVGDVKDEIDFARGVFIQKCVSVTGFSQVGTNTNTKTLWKKIDYNMVNDKNKTLCSHTDNYAHTSSDNVHFYVSGTGATVYVPLEVDANSVEVIATLETPQEIPLTETELNAYRHLMTNKGTTTILSEAEAEVDYYINKPNAQAIGNIHAQVNEDYFKLQQAIISLGGN